MIRPLTVWLDGPSTNVQVVDALVPDPAYVLPASEPPLQSNAYRNPAAVSAFDGSDWPPKLIVTGWPFCFGPLLLSVAVGAAFDTVTWKVFVAKSPSLSVTFTVTVYVPLSS